MSQLTIKRITLKGDNTMGMIKKTVTGISEDMKLVKSGKSYPKVAMGGTQRTSFTGSSDNRAAGNIKGNEVLKSAPGYIDQGDVYMGDVSHSRSFTKAGNRGPATGQAKVTSENVTGGMGGKFWKEPEGF